MWKCSIRSESVHSLCGFCRENFRGTVLHDDLQISSKFFEPLINTPFRRPSCQAREEEKEVLADSNQPTAPPSTKLHVSYCAARARRREKWRPKVHQARRDDRFSSRFLSLLLTAAIVPTHPTPLLLCSPLPLSLSDQVWCIQRCDCVNCT